MINKNFDINEFIETAEKHYNKFYEKFIKKFDSKEALQVFLKLTFDDINDEYKFYINGDGFFGYRALIRDLGLYYNVYKDCGEYNEDWNN